MPKSPQPFGEWRPDLALLDNQFASEALNVFADVSSYLPFPSLLPFTTFALPATCCGLYSARTTSGTWKTYAGTATKLYLFSVTGWIDVSRTVGGVYHVASGDLWSFEQSGTKLVAVNEADEPQVIDIDSGTNFANLAGSPPKATNVKQLGDFLFFSGLQSNKRLIHWSGINDITQHTVGLNLCDEQEFPDCGPVQGVAGGEIGYVVQERGIRTIQFLPGDTTYIFNFSRVLHDRGCISKYGFCAIGNVLYFVSEDGFYSVSGQQVTPISADKTSDWFLANSDVGRRNVIIALAGVNKPRVVWAFHKFSGSLLYDHEIIFHWDNGRWTHADEQAQIFALLASEGLDLDTTGTEPDDVDIDSTALSLDSFAYLGGRPLIGGIDENGMLSALTGPALPATMETAEAHLVPGLRAFVSDAYPLVDDAAETVAAGTRERLQDNVFWNPPQAIEITGAAALYTSARLHRFRVTTYSGAVWTHAQGVLVDAQQDGSVA